MPTELHGKYTVEDQVLGQGAWSIVKPCAPIPPYVPPNTQNSAHTGALVTSFVAKVIDKEHLQTLTGGTAERAKAEVDREVTVLRSLPPHPNVAAFIECLETPTHFYIIFEEAAHGDLCELILKSPGSRLAEPEAKKYCVEMLMAVLHCHRHGIAHRDVKPENLLVGRGNVLKLTDFGLAKLMRPTTTTPASSAPASPSKDGESTLSSGPPPATYVFDSADPIAAAMYPNRMWAPKKGGAVFQQQSGSPVRNAEGASASSTSNNKSAATDTNSKVDWNSVPPSHLPSPPVCEGHEIIGTLRYGAPEMFHGKFTNTPFDAFGADAWSVGVVAYIMLTGSFPFSAGGSADERQTYQVLRDTQLALPPPPEQGGVVTHSARDFLRRMLSKDPKQRMRLWDALDHPWLRDEVKRQRQLASSVAALPMSDAKKDGGGESDSTGNVLGEAAFRCFPLSPALTELHAELAKNENPVLRTIYNKLVDEYSVYREALARLRQHAIFPGDGVSGLTAPQPASNGGSTGVSTIRKTSQSPAPSSNRNPSRPRTAGTTTSRSSTPVPNASSSGVPNGTPPQSTTGGSRRVLHSPAPSPHSRLDSPSRVPPRADSGATTPTSASRNAGGIGGRSPAPLRNNNSNAARSATPTKHTTSATGSQSGQPPPLGTPTSASSSTSAAAQARRGSPLARASPVARRGTPMRRPATGAAAPAATASSGSTTPSSATRRPASSNAPPPLSPLPNDGSRSGGGGAATATGNGSAAASSSGVAAAAVAVGDSVTYRGAKATIHFIGTTQFANGQWIGLEMLEGKDGIHDGTSSVDHQRYFTCPKGKGLFVRPSQVKKAD